MRSAISTSRASGSALARRTASPSLSRSPARAAMRRLDALFLGWATAMRRARSTASRPFLAARELDEARLLPLVPAPRHVPGARSTPEPENLRALSRERARRRRTASVTLGACAPSATCSRRPPATTSTSLPGGDRSTARATSPPAPPASGGRRTTCRSSGSGASRCARSCCIGTAEEVQGFLARRGRGVDGFFAADRPPDRLEARDRSRSSTRRGTRSTWPRSSIP